MKAIICPRYGGPDVLTLVELDRPQPRPGELLIRIHATAVNSADWRIRKADPMMVRLFMGFSRPRQPILGVVFAGVVAGTGPGVTGFQVGDRVFGLSDQLMGTYAEYLAFPASGTLAPIPAQLSYAEAACLPFGGHTALHFLEQVDLKAGQHVMVYGAAGAVGTAVVQLAALAGAEVTAVCSSANVAMVSRLGARHVIDYTKTDPLPAAGRYDLIFETVNKAPAFALARGLKPGGTLILGSALVGGMLAAAVLSILGKKRVLTGEAKGRVEHLQQLAQLAARGQYQAVIDRTYPLAEMVQAHAYVEQGHKRGNVVIEVVPG